MQINIVGDFVSSQLREIKESEDISRFFSSSDFNIVNFEAPLTVAGQKPAPKSGPSLSQNIEGLHWLKKHRFNVFCLANNHIFDFGDDGFEFTRSKIDSKYCIGAGSTKEAYSPLILTSDSIKVAVFSFAEMQFGVFNQYFHNFSNGVAWINDSQVEDVIRDAKKNVDFVIVIAHAGLECEDVPLPEWRSRYRRLIDVGCDLIVGGHTHCSQGYEIYHDKYIYYSLGNFYFPEIHGDSANWNIGEVLSVSVINNKLTTRCLGVKVSCEGQIEFIDSKIWNSTLEILNSKLSTDIYDSLVEKMCERHLVDYLYLSSWSGFIHPKTLTLKQIVKILLHKFTSKKTSYNSLHMLNNLQCESHRWTFIRGLISNKFIKI